jgi:hypothetical protein
LDTEFYEDGKTIDLISIGLVHEDGSELYLESAEADLERAAADPWMAKNVLPHLTGERVTRAQIREEILRFVGPSPEFWAYYADYDWVVLCQLFGRMVDLPQGWPMFCMDLKQEATRLGVPLPPAPAGEHNALEDARWVRLAYQELEPLATSRGRTRWSGLQQTLYDTFDALEHSDYLLGILARCFGPDQADNQKIARREALTKARRILFGAK